MLSRAAGGRRAITEAVRTLGVYNCGGELQTRLRNQMKRLFGCTVQLTPGGLDNAKSSPPHHRNRPRVSEPTG